MARTTQALGITVRLQRVQAEQYALINQATGDQVGTIRRRDSWRVHDWYAEIAVGDIYINHSDETLSEAFEGMQYTAQRRLRNPSRQVLEEMRGCAARLRERMAQAAEPQAPALG